MCYGQRGSLVHPLRRPTDFGCNYHNSTMEKLLVPRKNESEVPIADGAHMGPARVFIIDSGASLSVFTWDEVAR